MSRVLRTNLYDITVFSTDFASEAKPAFLELATTSPLRNCALDGFALDGATPAPFLVLTIADTRADYSSFCYWWARETAALKLLESSQACRHNNTIGKSSSVDEKGSGCCVSKVFESIRRLLLVGHLSRSRRFARTERWCSFDSPLPVSSCYDGQAHIPSLPTDSSLLVRCGCSWRGSGTSLGSSSDGQHASFTSSFSICLVLKVLWCRRFPATDGAFRLLYLWLFFLSATARDADQDSLH